MQDEKECGHEVQEKRAKLISLELNKTCFVGLFFLPLKKMIIISSTSFWVM